MSATHSKEVILDLKTLLFSVALVLSVAGAHAEGPDYPKLFFKYSFLYDGVCAGNNPVDQAWADEATSRQSEITKLWESNAPQLLGKLIEEFGRGFSRKEMTATLSVCPGAPSFSNPLVLNISSFMKSFMKNKPVRPNAALIDLIFHELLHSWVSENIGARTPLLEKYKGETVLVRNHLHLMAIEKYIYLRLRRTDLLRWITLRYPQMLDGYGRAWDIVNRIEGYKAFIAEIP